MDDEGCILQLLFLLAFASKTGSQFALIYINLFSERFRGTSWLLLRASATRPTEVETAFSSTANFKIITADKLIKL